MPTVMNAGGNFVDWVWFTVSGTPTCNHRFNSECFVVLLMLRFIFLTKDTHHKERIKTGCKRLSLPIKSPVMFFEDMYTKVESHNTDNNLH